MSGEQNTATADTPQVLLEHHLKQLRLPTVLREYDKVARQCAAESGDYPRYLLRLTELELLDRERQSPFYLLLWSTFTPPRWSTFTPPLTPSRTARDCLILTLFWRNLNLLYPLR